jgi:SPP1 gp7 family putative phage head morphogenesis protein
LNRYKNQLSAVIETFISSVSSFLNHSIGSLFFDEYQWVSVLDSHTTEICRGRDGNVYRYGKGPIPPAHYRCRSSIMPIVDYSLKVMPTFSNWVSRQPRPVMDDILGSGLAQRTRTGGATGQDIVNAIRKRKLTLDQFAGKRNLILTSK